MLQIDRWKVDLAMLVAGFAFAKVLSGWECWVPFGGDGSVLAEAGGVL